MKKTVCKWLLGCLMFALVIMVNIPASAKSKKNKVVMPKKVTEKSVNDDGEVSPYPTVYTISYDKSGRIKKISASSKATDTTWTYTISYKKSGKNTKATINYDPSWADSPEKFTYTFNSKGYLVSNNKSSDWEWSYVDESKDSIFMGAEGDGLVFFDKNDKLYLYYQLEEDKITSVTSYEYENGKMTYKETFYFSSPIALEEIYDITDETLETSDSWVSQYEEKTSKVSMTDAVKWMNTVLLFEFVYRG